MEDSSLCPACGRDAVIPAGTLPMVLHGGSVRTSISECGHCHSFWRTPPEKAELDSHLSAAGYTDDALRERMRALRRPLFMQVGRIVDRARGRWERPAILDVGCAHGHLLDHFAEKGFSCAGVEPVARLSPSLEDRGIAVHARLEDVSPDRPYDLITFIDTLYWFDMPASAFARALSLLSPDGIIVVRIANRTPFLRLMRPWRGRTIYSRVFGDQLVALSHRGVVEMVRRAGARLRSSHFYEARSFTGIADRVLYRGLGTAAALTRLPISPGILYVISRS